MGTLLQDISYAARMMRRSPGFTLAAALTLALGIGANAVVFNIADALALRPLRVADAAHLVAIFTSGKSSQGPYLHGPTSYPDLVDYRSAPAFSGIAGYGNRGSLLRVGDESVMLMTSVVTENYFSLLQVHALYGRVFSEEEFQGPDTPQEVVVTYSFWQKYLGGDVRAVGSNITLSGKPLVVIGVLPKDFRGTDPIPTPDLFMPATVWGRGEMADRANATFRLLARVKPGVDLRQAQAQMDTVARRLTAAYPKEWNERVITLEWEPQTRAGLEDISYLFLSIAALVLLIACANVAGLLLARGETRRREIATRLAIGAGRLRIARQLITESLMLSLLGMGMAVLAVSWIIQALPGLLPAQVAMLGLDFRLDQRTILFSFAAALFAVLIFAIVPAVRSTRMSLVSELKQGEATGGVPGRVWSRHVLIVGQVALSVVLLTGAGLLVRTFIKLSGRDMGFDSRGQIMLAQVMPDSRQAGLRFLTSYPELLQRIEAIPGVERASIGNRVPFADYGGGVQKTVYISGMHLAPNEQGVPIYAGKVDGAYFQTLGMQLIRGRTFGLQDQPNSQRVAILNESAARRLFPDSDPVGQHFRLNGAGGQDCEIVGIVRDAKYNDPKEGSLPYMYLSYVQEGGGDTVLLVKARFEAGAVATLVRREIHAFDSSISVFSVETMSEHMREALYFQRASSQMALTLGFLGLSLAVIGLYGVLSYYVNQRRHEIGVRLAVGARPGAVFLMIVRRGLGLAALGTAIGLAGGIAVMQVLADLLFGVSPHDPATVASVAFAIMLVALLAAAVPARRAANVDPMEALRQE